MMPDCLAVIWWAALPTGSLARATIIYVSELHLQEGEFQKLKLFWMVAAGKLFSNSNCTAIFNPYTSMVYNLCVVTLNIGTLASQRQHNTQNLQ